MSINCKVKVKHGYKKINNLIERLPETSKLITEDIIKNIRGYAIKLERGHNEKGIVCELIDTTKMEVKGRIYANPNEFMSKGQSYLFFEYFGTGAYAEQAHIGKTNHFVQSGYTEWLIPVNMVDNELNYPRVTVKEIPGVEFYLAHGVKANHFLTDAEFESREENKEIEIKKLNEMIKEICQ